MNDLPGKLIGLAIAFALLVGAPFVCATVESEMLDRRHVVIDVCNFIDEVVDSRQITDSMIDELNVNLASYGMQVNYEVVRYARNVDSDPLKSGGYYVSYVPVNDWDFEKGDKISVHVWVTGYSTAEGLSHKISGMYVKQFDETFTARVR